MNVNGKNLFKICMFTPGLNGRMGIPLLYEGDPGIGKTSIIRSWAHEFGLGFYDMIAMLYQPPDFGGYPVPTTDAATGKMRINSVPLSIFTELPNNCVLLLDELSLAPPAVQKALMRVVLEGRVGDHTLPKGVRIVAAQNDPRDCAGHPLLAPLANRFSHQLFPKGPAYSDGGESWCNWLLSPEASTKPSADTCNAFEQQVQKGWEGAFAKSRGIVVEFIRNRTDVLDIKPPHNDPNASKAWPSRRTWEMAVRVMATGDIFGANPIEEYMLVGSLIGDAVAKEFAEFRSKLDLPNPVDVLDGKTEWKFNKNRPDITYAVLNAMRAVLEPKDCLRRLERCQKFFQIIGEVEREAPDIALTCASTLMSIPESMTPETNRVLAKLLPTASAMRGVQL